ncbi:MAG TPA: LysE family translocator [Pseudolabrys sp.]|nr:LysE family translocator [Pseudolabrys sp.]
MPLDLLIALTVFSTVMAFTPGPNNIMLAASGVNFGFAHTIPHMLGVTIGFGVLLIACAAGLGLIFAAVPELHLVLKIGGALYMLWLAFKVATAHATADEGRGPARPFTFMQAAAFQWINPKAVIAALSAITLYVRPGQFGRDFPVMLAILTVCTVGAVATWTGFGVALRRLLRNPLYARVFNVSMALLLVASIVPMVS